MIKRSVLAFGIGFVATAPPLGYECMRLFDHKREVRATLATRASGEGDTCSSVSAETFPRELASAQSAATSPSPLQSTDEAAACNACQLACWRHVFLVTRSTRDDTQD